MSHEWCELEPVVLYDKGDEDQTPLHVMVSVYDHKEDRAAYREWRRHFKRRVIQAADGAVVFTGPQTVFRVWIEARGETRATFGDAARVYAPGETASVAVDL